MKKQRLHPSRCAPRCQQVRIPSAPFLAIVWHDSCITEGFPLQLFIIRKGLYLMEAPVAWCVGDWVQTTQPRAGLPCGSTGTIRRLFPAGDFCDVRFDGKLLPRLVLCSM